jgi:hypothetical protein
VEIPRITSYPSLYEHMANSALGLHSASPLTMWLRVPLPWYSSATFAQFPDETHASIQRTFVAPAVRRQFCGFCGSHLSSWNEHSPDDAQHICLTVGSLLEDDQARLSELGLLPDDSSDDGTNLLDAARVRTQPQARGAPWFEEIVRNSRLGKFKQQRGGHEENGVHVEWEVVEWTEDDDEEGDSGSATPSKRKIGDVEAEDFDMRSA